MFGSRADLFIDVTFAVTLLAPLAPLAAWLSMRAARARSHELLISALSASLMYTLAFVL